MAQHSFNLTRLSLFAYISAIEEDLRDLANRFFGESADLQSVFGENLLNTSKTRYLKSEGKSEGALRVSDLLQYADFSDAFALLNRNRTVIPPSLVDHLTTKTTAFEKLATIRNKVCHCRPIEHEDTIFVFDLCEELRSSRNFPWQKLRKTHEKLAENPLLALDFRIPPAEEKRGRVLHNLPLPDFDETGYVGRKIQIAELTKHCLGTFPVVTVVGEGGVGKTAILLRVAYEILDSKDCPFEAIIWSSSRTSQLTATEVKKIEGAISNSLGLLRNISNSLGGGDSDEPIEEVLKYLTEFKILLILDNLETVLDQRLLAFIRQLPKGSKILISSRIGLGTIEFQYNLKPLDKKDSVLLLRLLMGTRQLDILKTVPQPILESYCEKMGNNPLFIKWFAAATQSGRRPEDILANPSLFLEFCFSNVYQYLSPDSRGILQVIEVLGRPLNQAEVSFLSDVKPVQTQRSIMQLLTTNMIAMTGSAVAGGGYETQYEMTEMAQQFFRRSYPVSVEMHRGIKKRQQSINEANVDVERRLKKSRYAFDSIVLRSTRDVIVAKMLLDALEQAKSGDFTGAYHNVEQAKALSADYFEVYKMGALVAFYDKKYSIARDEYRTAIEIEPKAAPLRVLYGGFLLRTFQDVEAATEQLEIARMLDPTAYQVRLEFARCRYEALNFKEAEKILTEMWVERCFDDVGEKKVIHLLLKVYHQASEKAERESDALMFLEKFREFFCDLSYAVVDDGMRETVRYLKGTIFRLERRISAEDGGRPELAKRADDLRKWVVAELAG